jgi:hypothetical protein
VAGASLIREDEIRGRRGKLGSLKEHGKEEGEKRGGRESRRSTVTEQLLGQNNYVSAAVQVPQLLQAVVRSAAGLGTEN